MSAISPFCGANVLIKRKRELLGPVLIPAGFLGCEHTHTHTHNCYIISLKTSRQFTVSHTSMSWTL